LSFIL